MNYKKLSELIIYMSRGISPKYSEVGIPVINQKCIRNGQLVFQDVKFHNSNKTYPEDKILRINDIVINSTGVGTLGRVARIAKLKKLTLADSHITIVRPDVRKVDPLYLYYVLRFNESAIIELATGSTGQTELSRAALSELSLPLIERRDQEYISKNLDYIDNKILVNNALSKTLEDIAQTFFKSWFIDFDPVKAKMNGEKPIGMDDETAALFPDSFEESELGLIPKGWEFMELGNLITPKKGKTITKATCVEGLIPVVAGGLQPAYFHNKANVSAPVVTISASGANAGFVRLYLEDIWASDCTFISHEITRYVFYWYLFLSRNQEKIYDMQQGAAQPHIYPSDLMRLKICTPNSVDLISRFEETISPLFLEIGALMRTNTILNEIRDSLIPKLISGELQIPEEMLAS